MKWARNDVKNNQRLWHFVGVIAIVGGYFCLQFGHKIKFLNILKQRMYASIDNMDGKFAIALIERWKW